MRKKNEEIKRRISTSSLISVHTIHLATVHVLFTDGIVIFANNTDELQNGLDLLYDFCSKWKLSININKTKIMIFRKHTHKKVKVIISR